MLHSPISAHPSSEVITASFCLYKYYCLIFLFSHYFLHQLDQPENKTNGSHSDFPILYVMYHVCNINPKAIVVSFHITFYTTSNYQSWDSNLKTHNPCL